MSLDDLFGKYHRFLFNFDKHGRLFIPWQRTETSEGEMPTVDEIQRTAEILDLELLFLHSGDDT